MGMYIWYGFLITMGVIEAVYLIFRFKRFHFVQTLSKGNKKLQYAIAAIPVLVLFVLALFDMIPVLIISMYLMITWMLCDLVAIIIRKFTKKSCKYYLAGIAAIVIMVCFFGYGYINAHHIVKTEINLTTNKRIKTQGESLKNNTLKIAMFADSHVGCMFDGEGFKKISKDIMKNNPDIVLVCGDYVDDDTTKKDMVAATKALGEMKPKLGTYMVFGNHDDAYFHFRDFSFGDLKKELKKNNVNVLEDQMIVPYGGFYLVGRKDKHCKNRKSLTELMKDADTNKLYSIVLDHQPNDFDGEAKANPDLVLCGHTHAGQLIPLGWGTDIFHTNDLRYGMEKRKNTTFFVTSGIAGWGLPFKTGAKAEYVIINVKSNVK